MVYGLQTLKKLNDAAAEKARHNGHCTGISNGVKIPKAIQLNAAAIREFINRPWTAAELKASGSKDVYAEYAASAREPFHGRKGQTEPIRG